jgi:sigma-E factor negative regulatory protein RseB
LPSGFVLSSYKANRSTGKETWVYTDGLATFSIFIDSSEVSKNFPPVQATLGTTVAVLNKVNLNNTQYAITVVGEIPTLTAQQIVADISPRIRALPDSQ